MNSAELLKQYDAIWRLTQKMLEAANQEEWDYLIELEQTRAEHINALMKRENEALWTQGDQFLKADLIRRILAADEEIKTLTVTWMGELQDMLGSIGTEKKLSKTYESP